MCRRTPTLMSLLLALAAAGCGGAEDSHDGAADAAAGGGERLSLVAYSTPEVVYDEIVPAFGKTAEGRGVRSGRSTRRCERSCERGCGVFTTRFT